ncbi:MULTISPECIES: hypothetical protein [unclassified Pseudomonas]|uniref:hypothetical protein n=1 Tax=unclassified Pseudomonas TaxID=196821 RepID=UPI002AC993D3|nr:MULTISPECIES: hypothetical protein [unclassified Pseudomonas]MEB0045662.1 hypothetical protein [Pseudomonas sp. Dout3]MEB0095545.1 hypothetical protein [Pseudomonas sp. DC1.2]WPX61126.1 hypothetical protein RHM68_10970 [Pseudomonas sp. DC1.2]
MQKPIRLISAFVRSLPPAQGRTVRRNLLFVSLTLSALALLTMITHVHAEDARLRTPFDIEYDADCA